MASIIFTAKDIFDQDFKREVRGYNKDEVNEFLDDVIKDYETYAVPEELREENARLREELAQKAQETPQTSPIASTATQVNERVRATATNF